MTKDVLFLVYVRAGVKFLDSVCDDFRQELKPLTCVTKRQVHTGEIVLQNARKHFSLVPYHSIQQSKVVSTHLWNTPLNLYQ